MINHVTCTWFSKNFGTLALKNSSVIVKKKSTTSFYWLNHFGHRKDVKNVQNLYWNHSAAPSFSFEYLCPHFYIWSIRSFIISWIIHVFWLILSCSYSTAHVYVNCADKFHMLRCSVVRLIYTLFAHMVEKNAPLKCLCYSVI